MNIFSHFVFLVISFLCPLLDSQVKIVNGSLITPVVYNGRVGTISICTMFRKTSRSRKEAKVAIEMVIYDVCFIRNQSLLLHFRNSQARPGPAALEAKDLISGHGVKVFLGAHKWDKASAIAGKASDEAHDHVPVFLSFADSISATLTFPWVLQATPNQKVQMNPIAAIYTVLGIASSYFNKRKCPHLIITRVNNLILSQQSKGEFSQVYTLTLFNSNKLKKHTVFVILATLGPGYRLYQLAKKLNMTEVGSAWITTLSITDLFHSISHKNMSSMQDIIETRPYFSDNWQIFYNFGKRLDFRNIFADEEHHEPGIFPSQAYNPVQSLFHEPDITNRFQRIIAADPGVELQFINWKRTPSKVIEFPNIIGKPHQSWYMIKDFGFLETIDVEALYLNSVESSKEVLLPAQSWYTERRRHILTNRSELIRVGVPAVQSMFLQFVKVEYDPKFHETSSDGLSVGVFKEAMKLLDVIMTYNFSSFVGEYDELLKNIAFWDDALVGDVTILKQKHKYANFSNTEVPIQFRLPIQKKQTDERRRRFLTSRSEPVRVGVPVQSMFQQLVKVETDPKTNVTSYDGFSLKVFEAAMNIADVNNEWKYNYYPFDGGYDNLVKQIALGKFDAVAGDVTILEERHKYADFSRAYTESGIVLVVPIRSRSPIQMWLFMNPFTTELWGLILAITIYNGFIIWLIERNHNPEFRSGTVLNQIGTLFWPATTTLFTLSADKLHSNLSRMVMAVWLFVALILTQSYTSILSNMLTAQRLAPATKDVETLKKMNATVGYCRGSFLKSYMINALGFDSVQIKKYSSTSAYAKALISGEIAGIFLEVPSAKLFLAQYCKSFMRTEKIFKVGGYGFAFKKNFPLLPDINKALLKISENGKLLELEEKYINSKECAKPVLISNEDASIGLDSFAILFVLSGCTSTVALAIYVIRKPSSDIVINLENPGNVPDHPCSEARPSISTESLEDHPEAPGADNRV